jgi:small basic protein
MIKVADVSLVVGGFAAVNVDVTVVSDALPVTVLSSRVAVVGGVSAGLKLKFKSKKYFPPF